MAQGNMVTVMESCMIAPPPGTAVSEISLPLTYFDLPFLHQPLIHHIFFNEYSDYSISHFTENVIPKLKFSLSLTLKHYYPLSGNLTIPRDDSSSRRPTVTYVPGNSVPLVFVASSQDFNHLTSNHARKADDFYTLVPKLPQPVSSTSGRTLLARILAVQVTVFPDSGGICIGFTFRRAPADGNAFHGFIRSFASILKFGNDEALLARASLLLPSYNRSVISDPNDQLATIFWNHLRKKKNFDGSQPEYVPTNKVRATFVMHQHHVQGLKQMVAEKYPNIHVSTFTVTCAYVWTCMVKSRKAVGEKIKENDVEHFTFGVDCRSFLVPPVAGNYFGNCLVKCITSAKTMELIQKDGFMIAAGLIGEAIREKMQNKGAGILNGVENFVEELERLNPEERVVGVAGSPRFAVYDMDFGWGKPKKSEVVSIDATGSISLNESRDSKGDLEVGLSLPEAKMEAFAAIFVNGLMKDNHIN